MIANFQCANSGGLLLGANRDFPAQCRSYRVREHVGIYAHSRLLVRAPRNVHALNLLIFSQPPLLSDNQALIASMLPCPPPVVRGISTCPERIAPGYVIGTFRFEYRATPRPSEFECLSARSVPAPTDESSDRYVSPMCESQRCMRLLSAQARVSVNASHATPSQVWRSYCKPPCFQW